MVTFCVSPFFFLPPFFDPTTHAGKMVIALGNKYHPEHFTCTFCRQQLVQGTFLEHNEAPYCKPCYIKLFG